VGGGDREERRVVAGDAVAPRGSAGGGKEKLDLRIPAGGAVTFKYRILIDSRPNLTDEMLNRQSEEFARG